MLKIGVIGCGKITQVRHAPEYDENPNCELVAWYDAIPGRAEEMAKLYGGKVYDSVEELLKADVDAVSVCVANADHASVTIKALEAGCHVLCEKPMAVTLEECIAMAETSKRTGKRLMLGHNQRYAKSHVKAHEMVAAGELGKIVAFHTTFAHPGPEGWTGQANSWFFDKNRAAFGAMADLGIHKTDLLHYLLGEQIVSVTAMMGAVDKKYPDGSPIAVDDNALCIYRTESGALGQMHVSWTNYGEEDNSTVLFGTKGKLRLYDDPEYSVIFEPRDGEAVKMVIDEMTSNKKQTTGGRTSTGVIDAFIDSILTGNPTVAEADEALKAMRVIFAADQSAREGRTVEVK